MLHYYYNNIHLHDPAAVNENFTEDYRTELIKYQLSKSEEDFESNRLEVATTTSLITSSSHSQELLSSILDKLDSLKESCRAETSSRIIRKLDNLYNG